MAAPKNSGAILHRAASLPKSNALNELRIHKASATFRRSPLQVKRGCGTMRGVKESTSERESMKKKSEIECRVSGNDSKAHAGSLGAEPLAKRERSSTAKVSRTTEPPSADEAKEMRMKLKTKVRLLAGWVLLATVISAAGHGRNHQVFVFVSRRPAMLALWGTTASWGAG